MPRHYYLPATFLASFSTDTSTEPRRDRRIWAGDNRQHKTFQAPASRLGAEKNLYTLVAAEHDPQMVDDTWREYEGGLSNAIEALIGVRVDARTWARVLVPFVACMLVRGPDFAGRFGRRLAALKIGDIDGGYTPADNANLARLMELQRLLGPVAVGKWAVVRFGGRRTLVTNDLGYAPFRDPVNGESGMVVPLGPSHALTVTPRREGKVAVVKSGEWFPDIAYVRGTAGDRDRLNRAMSAAAQRFVFGGDKRVVAGLTDAARTASPPPEPGQLGFITGTDALAHEFTWHRLVTAVERDPSDGGPWDFALDPEGLTRGWAPMLVLPATLPEFPPALRREGQSIVAEFYDPADRFEAARHYDRGVVHFENGEYDEALETLDASLELIPDRVATLYLKSTALTNLGRHGEALKVYDAALELNPGDAAEILFNRGIALEELGRPHEAIAAYDEALATEPDHGGALTNKGAILVEQGSGEEALRVLDAALEVRPGDAEAQFRDGWKRRKDLSHKGTVLASLFADPSTEP